MELKSLSTSSSPMDLVSSTSDGSDDSSSSQGGDVSPMCTSSDDDMISIKDSGSLSSSPVQSTTSNAYIPPLSFTLAMHNTFSTSSLNSLFRPVVPGPTSPYLTPRHDTESSHAMDLLEPEPIRSQSIDAHRCAQQIEALISNSQLSSQQHIDFSQRSNISSITIRTLPANTQSLNLSRCRSIVDADLLFLPAHLQALDLSHCTQLTDESLKSLPHSLQTLNISYCQFTDEGIKSLPMTLTSLDISMCHKVTYKSLLMSYVA